MGASQISAQKYSSLTEHFATFSELLVYGYVREEFNSTYFILINTYFYNELSYKHCYDCPIAMITKHALQSIVLFYGDGDEFNNFKFDFLDFRHNKSCQNLIYKYGDNFPNKEYIALSVELIKINKRNKEQQRIMVITNKAVYHLSCLKNGKKYKKILRRINIFEIIAITVSCSESNEFAFHIPQEYDTRYKSKYKNIIINTLSSVYKKIEGRNIIVINTPYHSLNTFVTTKDMAKKQTKSDKLKRVQSYVQSYIHVYMENSQSLSCLYLQ